MEDKKDLSMQIGPIAFRNALLYPQTAITIEVGYDGNMYMASYDPFGIDVYSKTMKGLKKEFNEYVTELWEIYVEADDSILSEDARALKRRLSNAFTLRRKDDYIQSSSTVPFSRYFEISMGSFSYANA